MSVHTEIFQGVSIRIAEDHELSIAGKSIHAVRDPRTKEWACDYLPYSTFPTLTELAQSIIRDCNEFDTDNSGNLKDC